MHPNPHQHRTVPRLTVSRLSVRPVILSCLGVSRLIRGSLIAGAALLGAGACGDDAASGSASKCFKLADGQCLEETFENPRVLQPDAEGVYQLSIGPTEVTLDGQRHCVRAYNGSYMAPTIETAARSGDTPRQVRVNLANRFTEHDFRSLESGACECKTASGASCVPGHVHDSCGGHGGHAHEDCLCTDSEGEACEHFFDFNVTNLHAHGSHVRPDYARGGEACTEQIVDGVRFGCRECGDDVCDDDPTDDTCFHADNVLNALQPGEGAQYRWDIDEDGTHHTGLQWYHPHIHGTTAVQVASGAAGAWIVRGALDQLPGIAAAKERVMVFSTPSIAANGFTPLAEGETCSDSTITFNDFEILAATTSPQLNLINGQRRPRLITAPGQVERWRILHAGYLDEVFLGLFRGADAECSSFSTDSEDTTRLTQIGRDGIILPQPFEHEYVFMSPGYRVEAMLGGAGKLRAGETWCLVAARFLQPANTGEFGEFGGQPLSPAVPPTPSEILARFETDGDVVAIVNVAESAGPATETELPDYAAISALAPSLALGGRAIEERCADAAAARNPAELEQAAVLQVGLFTADDPDPCECSAYNVNCKKFEETDRTRYPFDRDLPLGAVEHWRVGSSLDGHPFHIHINPFIVCPSENVFDPMPFPHWRDTYLVNAGRNVDVISEYRTFTGAFVFHCHKLTHEDHGMMELVRVCDPSEDTSCGSYGWRTCDPDDLACAQAVAATDCYLAGGSPAELAACVLALGGPAGVCGPSACGDDTECAAGLCIDHVCRAACSADTDCPVTDRCDGVSCLPAPCVVPCGPGQSCEHGVCG